MSAAVTEFNRYFNERFYGRKANPLLWRNNEFYYTFW